MNQTEQLFQKESTYSLRGICMLLIVLHHIYQYTASRYGVTYPMPLAIILQSLGYLATGVFFLLSGYGLTFSMKRSEPISLSYSVKQLLKIYKPFLFIWIISVGVDLLFFKQYGYNEHLMNALTLNLTVGGSFWFLKEIFLIYLLSFIVYSAFKSDSIRIWIIVVCILSFIVIGLYFKLGKQWLNSIFCFPIGMICYFNKEKLAIYNTNQIGFALLCLFIISFINGVLIGRFSLLFQMISCVALSLYSVRFVYLVNVKSNFLSFLGKNSLCIYLYHLYCLALLSFIEFVGLYFVAVVVSTLLLTLLYNRTLKSLSI